MRRSFFQRLTGAINTDDEFFVERESRIPVRNDAVSKMAEEKEQEAELAVDVSQTPTEIVIKTMVAGVDPNELDVSISQEMVTIRGSRSEAYELSESDFFHKELYWG